jgi:hypothetical protein
MSYIPVLVLLPEPEAEEIHRSVNLSNHEWLVLSQCTESFSAAYRESHSQVIATYVTRGQLDLAVEEAAKMNGLLQQLDKIQAKLVS